MAEAMSSKVSVGRTSEIGVESLYPLQRRFLQWGIILGLVFGLIFKSWIATISFLVLFACAGALWQPGVPILAYCIAFQWLYVVTGYLFMKARDYYPGFQSTDGIELAITLSLLGFVCLTAGIRLGIRFLSRKGSRFQEAGQTEIYDLGRLFRIVLIMSLLGWFMNLVPRLIWFEGAQIIQGILAFRQIITLVLFLSVIQQRRGYKYLFLALILNLVPAFASAASAVLGIFIGIFIVLLHEWRPWSRLGIERRKSRQVQFILASLVVITLFLGLVWEGGVKPTWRPIVMSGQVKGSPVEMADAFFQNIPTALSVFSWDLAIHASVGRLGSGVAYFAHVLGRVPSVLEHENGFLTWRALRHVAMPRFLYPDKPNLGSDSWLIVTYAGLPAAGWDQMTSIGLGYMAQFYIDWGIPFMFIPLFIYGLLIGLIYQLFHSISPSYNIFRASVIVLFVMHFSGYEAEFAKALGGLLVQTIIFFGILYFWGPWLHKKFMKINPIVRNRSSS